jgi:multiple antibiotic resistance protein
VFTDWATLIGVTISALLPIANPFSAAPVFVAITQRMGHTRRNQQARMAAIYMACILVVALLADTLILKFFGISLPALRMAGGLIIARVGFTMLDPAPSESLPAQDQREALDRSDIAFTPIAMPLLSGPGSIAVTISMATKIDGIVDFVPVCLGIAAVAFISWLVLRSSARVIDLLGNSGVNVLTRIMGLVLVCVGIQFVANGFLELLTDDGIVKLLKAAYPH